ncbi:MAG: ethylbenzene dehydrogenase-related protein [Planctomycetes bacterium]|nr:ethylbenzene dehydrogenase-related protein [Planctomycetota bacterium]
MRIGIAVRRVLPGGAAALLLALPLGGCGEAVPAARAAAAPADRGSDLYRVHCQACHGESGEGNGYLAPHLLPRPRNFVAARYRITSTLQNQPTDEDLLRTLRRGFPGTAMPSFAHLPAEDLAALVGKVKSFAERPIDPSADPGDPERTGPVPIPPEPPDGEESRRRGGELYAQGCAPCHGATGRGDGQQAQHDDLGLPTWPRNFASGEWKGGSGGSEIYRRIVAGLAGSPMPASPFTGDDAWHIVHWVRAQSDLDPEGRNEQRRTVIAAARAAGEAPLDPADPAWAKAEERRVALMPLWMRRTPRVQGVRVAALVDGARLSLRIRWEDPSPDRSTFGQTEFRDAVAVQVSADPEPPLFAMGGAEGPGKGGAVSLWMWKADRQADAGGKADLEDRFPDMAADGWPAKQDAKEGTLVHGLPLGAHDPLYLSGRAAGNPVSDLSGATAAESLYARGAGTVGFREGGAVVESRGEWKDGTWTVVLRRTLADAGEGAVALPAGGRASIAFALWNGSDGDRNGVKSATIWHELVLGEGGR